MSIKNTISSIWTGFKLTLKHMRAVNSHQPKGISDPGYFDAKGTVTIQYPHQQIPVPEVGRYQLDVEMDDCIVCDLCAKICPVDCITIEAIKSVEDMGKTSDGTTKRLHAAKFEIDMAKCMYCGLCTVVCPTECIVMTNTYDKSVAHISDLNYVFADMPEAEAAEKRDLLEMQVAEKQAAKEAAIKAMNKEEND